MSVVFFNYLALLVSITLPVISIGVLRLSDSLTIVLLIASLSFLMLTTFLLSKAKLYSEKDFRSSHLRNQKAILIVFVVGGIVSSLRLFLKFEQFRLRVDLDTPLLLLASLLWILTVSMLAIGILTFIAQLRKKSP